MIGQELLLAIDETLNGLIRNAEAIENVELQSLSEIEIEAFQKTQESLIQHLLHLDHHLEQKRKDLKTPHHRSVTNRIAAKRTRFQKMESSYHRALSKRLKAASLLAKRKTKKVLSKSS